LILIKHKPIKQGDNKMVKKIMLMAGLLLGIGLTTVVFGQDTGLVPVPVFSSVGVKADIGYDPVTGLYTYDYAISNPATNTGEIWEFDVDITQPKYGSTLSSDGLILSYTIKTQSFKNALSKMKKPASMVPVGINVPSGWSGDITYRGTAGCYSGENSTNLAPGETKGGFQFISRGLPTIRSIEIQPWWIMIEDDSASDEGRTIAAATTKSLKYTTKTIGPTAPPLNLAPATFLDLIKSYIDESVTLGWLTDTTLTSTLKAKLESIPALIDANDPSSAKVVLGEMMNLINNSTSSQLTSEAKGLLYYNVQYLKNQLPDTYIPPVKTFSVSPEKATLSIGSTFTLTVISKINGNPRPDYPVTVQVTSGPNEGLYLDGPSFTGSDGKAVFTYTSKKVGTDTVVARSLIIPSSLPSSKNVLLAMNDTGGVQSDISSLGLMLASSDSGGVYESAEAYVEVTWSGGPDLTIPFFIPPVIKTQSGNTIFITDTTENNKEIATTAAGPSITRYYISDKEIVDPKTAIVLGERNVPALAPGQSNESIELQFTVPEGLPAGTYYCIACADADDTVAELDETNNCVNNKFAIVAPIEVCGDFNKDFKVDAADASIIRGAFRSHKGDAKYIAEADYDGDGDIDYSDYQLWYNCYKAFINK
jgi:hypothetical protein